MSRLPLADRRYARPLFGLVLVTFLMPFVAVSCAGVKLMTVSGVELVVGKEFVAFEDPLQPGLPGRPVFTEAPALEPEPWAIAAAAVAAIGAVGGVGAVGVLLGIAGVGSLLALRLSLLEKTGVGMMGEMMGTGLQFEWGYWLALAGFVAAAAAATGRRAESEGTRRARASPRRTSRAGARRARASPRRRGSGLWSCPYCRQMIPIDSDNCPRCGRHVGSKMPDA